MTSEGGQPLDLVVVGHVTCDLVTGQSLPGGAAYYAGRAAMGLGLSVGMVTSWGKDFSHASALSGMDVRVRPARETSCFENRYGKAGRQQRLCGLAAPLEIEDVPAFWFAASAVYLCPVMGEVSIGMARHFSGLVGLGAQGWMRRAAAEGRVVPKVWRPDPRDLAHVGLVVLSDEDAARDPGIVEYLGRHVELVAFTHGRDGCEIFEGRRRSWVDVHRTTEVDPTGAGDVFGAVLLAALSRGWPAVRAARLASAAASVVVEGRGGELLDRVDDAWQRLALMERMAGEEAPMPSWSRMTTRERVETRSSS